MDFNKTPAKAIQKALTRANLGLKDVNYFEINEVNYFLNIYILIS